MSNLKPLDGGQVPLSSPVTVRMVTVGTRQRLTVLTGLPPGHKRLELTPVVKALGAGVQRLRVSLRKQPSGTLPGRSAPTATLQQERFELLARQQDENHKTEVRQLTDKIERMTAPGPQVSGPDKTPPPTAPDTTGVLRFSPVRHPWFRPRNWGGDVEHARVLLRRDGGQHV